MKKTIFISLLWGILSAASWAEFEWPNHHSVVRINGEVITASWKDGKPYVFRQQTLHLLHVRSGPEEVELAKVLQEQGFQMTLNDDGSIDCNKTLSLAVNSPPPSYDYEPPNQATGKTTPYRSTPRRSSHSKHYSNSSRHNKTQFTPGKTYGMVSNPSRPTTPVSSGPSRSSVDISASRALVQSVGQELAVQCRRPISWTFVIVEDDDANAWTTGEGKVFVTKALLQLQLTKDEIAGVLGHEIAHGARQHLAADDLQEAREKKAAKEAREAQARYSKAQSEYQSEMNKEQNQSGNQSGNSNIGAMMAKDKLDWETHRAQGQMRQAKRQDEFNRSYRAHETVFNHAQELEADSVGLGYCIAAGYRADGHLTALQKLRDHDIRQYGLQSVGGSKTHPPLSQRIERLQELLRQKGY